MINVVNSLMTRVQCWLVHVIIYNHLIIMKQKNKNSTLKHETQISLKQTVLINENITLLLKTTFVF